MAKTKHRNVSKLYCQCQISHKRRKKECLGKFKFSLNRLKKINSNETNINLIYIMIIIIT
jgi:hypothetical protein